MSLQKKCLTASAVTHGLLLLLVFVGSAFLPQKPKVDGPEFELFVLPPDAVLVDAPNMVGGGNPNAQLPPEQPAPQPPKAEQAKVDPPIKPPEAKPEQPKEIQKPVETKVQNKIDPEAFDLNKVIKKEKQTATKTESTFDLKAAQKRVIKPSATGTTQTRQSTENNTKVAAARTGAVSDALGRIKNNLSAVGGEYGIPGPGGAAFISYHLAIRKIYEDAWIPPTASRGDEPQVEVEVVVRRDGSLVATRILKRSGRAELDRTVQNTLNRVKKLPAFPAGSTDETRTFKFNFNLAEKLNLG